MFIDQIFVRRVLFWTSVVAWAFTVLAGPYLGSKDLEWVWFVAGVAVSVSAKIIIDLALLADAIDKIGAKAYGWKSVRRVYFRFGANTKWIRTLKYEEVAKQVVTFSRIAVAGDEVLAANNLNPAEVVREVKEVFAMGFWIEVANLLQAYFEERDRNLEKDAQLRSGSRTTRKGNGLVQPKALYLPSSGMAKMFREIAKTQPQKAEEPSAKVPKINPSVVEMSRLKAQLAGLELEEDLADDIRRRIKLLAKTSYKNPMFADLIREIEGMVEVAKRALLKEAAEESEQSHPEMDTGEWQAMPGIRFHPDGFPQNFVWGKEQGRVQYDPYYSRSLSKFDSDQQRAFAKAATLLAASGRRYPSLKTKKLSWGGVPHSPEDAFVSRAARYLRFSWHKEDGVLHLCFVFSRAERSIGYNTPAYK